MRPVEVEPDATAELADAARWYESRRRGLGVAFLAAVDQAIGQVARWPDAGAPIAGLPEDLPVRQVPVPGFPYRVAYLAAPAGLHVLAFPHDRRRPGYWHGRVRRHPQ